MQSPDKSEASLLKDAANRARALVAALDRDGAALARDPAWTEGAALYASAAQAGRRVLAELDRQHGTSAPVTPIQQPGKPEL